MRTTCLLLAFLVCVCLLHLAQSASPCAAMEKGKARVECYQSEAISDAFTAKDTNNRRKMLVGAMWSFCKKQNGHLRLIHCSARMDSSCNMKPSGKLCPTEYFYGGAGTMDRSAETDIGLGLGLYTFTRPVCSTSAAHRMIHNYNLQSKGNCAIIDPNALLEQLFFISDEDTGKHHAAPALTRSPANLIDSSLTDDDFAGYYLLNQKRLVAAMTRFGSSEVNLLGCIDFKYVKLIESTAPGDLKKCPKDITQQPSTDGKIGDIVYDDKLLSDAGNLADASVIPEFKASVFDADHLKAGLKAIKKGSATAAAKEAKSE